MQNGSRVLVQPLLSCAWSLRGSLYFWESSGAVQEHSWRPKECCCSELQPKHAGMPWWTAQSWQHHDALTQLPWLLELEQLRVQGRSQWQSGAMGCRGGGLYCTACSSLHFHTFHPSLNPKSIRWGSASCEVQRQLAHTHLGLLLGGNWWWEGELCGAELCSQCLLT